ncbi:MAG: hypothetical protein GY913_33655 [Proteobacteria bacterium]|nr:hypothetical protein [Pseudomonadota bacterium]MCP4921874.1 hypothetical protein [Pseudomonadota bacterium]
MRSGLILALGAISLTTGCVVYTDDHHEPEPPQYVNYTPYVSWAESGCYYDDYNHDFVWWFETEIFDDNGRQDIVGVWADVYSVHGNLVDSFELYNETADPDVYFSDWLQYSTNLDCYNDGYEVDIVAYDTFDTYDAVTIYPYTY